MEEKGIEGGCGGLGVEEGKGDGEGEGIVVGGGEEDGFEGVRGEGDIGREGSGGGSRSSVWKLAVARRRLG